MNSGAKITHTASEETPTDSKSQGCIAVSDRWQRGHSLSLRACSSSLILEIKHEPARLSQPDSSWWEQGQKQAQWSESGTHPRPPLPVMS